MALAAVLAPVPISRIAVFVRARASAPVCNEDGDDPKRLPASWAYDIVVGGKMLSVCAIAGERLI